MNTFIFYYYFIGLPLAYTFALKLNFGLLGIWVSLSFCSIMINLTLIFMICRTNIDLVVKTISNELE